MAEIRGSVFGTREPSPSEVEPPVASLGCNSIEIDHDSSVN